MPGNDKATERREFIRGLPKAELHVHLEGSLAPETLIELAGKHGLLDDGRIPSTLDALREWYGFRDFPHFIEVYETAVHALRDEEDFARLAEQTGRSLAEQGVRYAEVTWTPFIHLDRGVPAEVVFDGYEHGRKEAERRYGIRMRWITDFPGHAGLDAGMLTLDTVLAHGSDAVVGFGVGGIEVERAQFRELFRRARAHGLRSNPHAGETTGPATVRSALDDLGAERIGHGIASAADPELMNRLRDEGIPLEVCLTSNVRTRSVPSLREHPLPRLVAAGVPVTVATDDPPMFGTTLLQEYEVAADILGLDEDGLTDLAAASFDAAFLPEREKRAYLAELRA
jgi:aminodeoxyfutalosine deaminase